MEKHNLYIVLTRTNTMMSKLIQLFTNDEYTHAAISLNKELEDMYSFGRKYTYNPFLGRFKKEDINKGVYKFCDTLPGVIIEVEVSKEQYEKVKALLNQFILKGDFYKYNYMGLLNSLLNKSVCYDDRFLCSEFVYYILKESCIADLNMSRNLVRPKSLLSIEGNMIYEGDLKEIINSNENLMEKEINVTKLNVAYK